MKKFSLYLSIIYLFSLSYLAVEYLFGVIRKISPMSYVALFVFVSIVSLISVLIDKKNGYSEFYNAKEIFSMDTFKKFFLYAVIIFSVDTFINIKEVTSGTFFFQKNYMIDLLFAFTLVAIHLIRGKKAEQTINTATVEKKSKKTKIKA